MKARRRAGLGKNCALMPLLLHYVLLLLLVVVLSALALVFAEPSAPAFFLDDDQPADLLSLSRYEGSGNDGGYRVERHCVCLADVCHFPSVNGWTEIRTVKPSLSPIYTVACKCELGGTCKIAYFSKTFDTKGLYWVSQKTRPEGGADESIDTSGWRAELRGILRARNPSAIASVHKEFRPILVDPSGGQVNERVITPAQVTMCVLLRTSEDMPIREGCTYL